MHLDEMFEHYHPGQMVIRMGSRTWFIPIQKLHLGVKMFDEFWTALDLQQFDYLVVIILHTAVLMVVFHADDDSKRIY